MSHGLTQMLQTMDGTNIEMRIAYQCAPLLAGLKPSNLLMLREREVTYVQWMLKQAGISYFIVAQEKGKAAVLLYNKGELQRYLAQEQVAGSLKKMGYCHWERFCMCFAGIMRHFCGEKQSFRMKWDFCWDIRLRMWKALSVMEDRTVYIPGTGKSTITSQRSLPYLENLRQPEKVFWE